MSGRTLTEELLSSKRTIGMQAKRIRALEAERNRENQHALNALAENKKLKAEAADLWDEVWDLTPRGCTLRTSGAKNPYRSNPDEQ